MKVPVPAYRGQSATDGPGLSCRRERPRRRFWLAVRRRWGAALLALGLLLVACGTSSPSSASTKDTYTTTADGVPQSLHVAQSSYGPKTGMHIVGSPNLVWVWGQSGRVTFGLFLTNKGDSVLRLHCSRSHTDPGKWRPSSTLYPSGVLPGTWRNDRARIS
jgi:hypothetical protein